MCDNFTVRFGKQISSYYKRAVGIAKRFDHFTGYEKSNPHNEIVTSLEELSAKSKDSQKLVEIISGWKSTEYFVGTDPIDIYEIRKYVDVVKCIREYQDSVISENHCYLPNGTEGWGCKFLRRIRTR